MKLTFYDWCIENNREDLLKYWDSEKNLPLTPKDVAPKSNKEYWWHCSVCNGSWQSRLSSRVGEGNSGRYCPFCTGKRVKIGYNDLNTTNHELALSWNYEKNSPLTPEMVTKGCSKKVWWTCDKCNNVWDAVIVDRVSGNGCPYCSNKRIKPGYNDLATKYPEIAKTWDYEKNYPITPDQVPPHGAKKFWWICPQCGDSWRINTNERVKRDYCPKCGLQSGWDKLTIPKDGNSLNEKCPEVAKTWDYEKNSPITPSQVSAFSGRKYWWICEKCGHNWEASVSNRAKGRGCPRCGMEKRSVTLSTPVKGKSLADVNPEVAQSWDYTKNSPVTPDKVTPKTMTRYWWICSKCGNSWKAAVASRANGSGCSYCSGKSVKAGFNDLAYLIPDLAKTWDYEKNYPITPDQITPYSNKSFWWLCPNCGYSWEAKANNRANGYGCPKCMSTYQTSTSQKTIEYYFSQVTDCIPTYRPDFLGKMEIDVYLPKLKVGIEFDGAKWHKNNTQNDLKKNRLCEENGITLIRIRENGLSDIPGSSNYFVIKNDFNSFREIIDRIASDLSLPPITYDLERDSARIYALYHQSAVERSIESTNPDLAKSWDYEKNFPLTPDRVPAYSNKKFWWICPDCGNSWETTAGHRSGGRGCPKCARQKTILALTAPKENESFADLYPKLSKSWDYSMNGSVTPEQISPKTQKKFWWICPKCQNPWEVSPSNRVTREFCRQCSYKKRVENRTTLEEGQDLESLYPDIAKSWDYEKNNPLTPNQISPHNGKKVWWVCPDCGNSWQTRVEHRVDGHGCPKCSHKKAWEKRRMNR